MHTYYRKIYKFIKTVHKCTSYNSLIYKIIHVKSSFFQKHSQSHNLTFFTPVVPDKGYPPIHNLHLKTGPMTVAPQIPRGPFLYSFYLFLFFLRLYKVYRDRELSVATKNPCRVPTSYRDNPGRPRSSLS